VHQQRTTKTAKPKHTTGWLSQTQQRQEQTGPKTSGEAGLTHQRTARNKQSTIGVLCPAKEDRK